MTDAALEAELMEIMRDVLDVDDLNYDENLTADDVEEWDSLSHVRLIVAVEKHFGVRFSTQEIEAMRRLGDLRRAITTKKAGAA
ncbi:acyl carrier protein [Rubrimonas cliftonensis]|uniref:Acyl carrier protein n=1 Tax=Rubrimonas cliftonensis TaxID=89524 RepID=A0A1H4CVM2_9RHOB|nr:acyl carrier protein [Rubrimonas cliftonensis]SEA64455.1 acyl carrier protein [Rubrimonas cliftonensis]